VNHLLVKLLKTFTPVKTYGPIEFFMTVLAMDMVAPTTGTHTLKTYFRETRAASVPEIKQGQRALS
jgi:hypothetical protein